jgi:N-dimethylarginine dimethylaminohydrolase
MMDLYLMSPPSRGWALKGRANFRSREAAPVDALAARREWLALAEGIEARGGTVCALEAPSDDLTGMPYAAECGHVVVAEDGAPAFLLPRMLAPHRRGERDAWAKLAARMGLRTIDPVGEGGGIWEAQGDVAELLGVTLLFFGGRTDRAGMEAAARFFPGELLRVEIREPAFHGNMAALPLPAVGRMLVCPDVVAEGSLAAMERRFGRDRLLFVSEDEIRCYATNGLPVGRSVLAPSLVPERVAKLFEDQGLEVVRFSMRELCEKAGGASRCLVSYARLPDGAVTIPREHRLDAVAERIRGDDASARD